MIDVQPYFQRFLEHLTLEATRVARIESSGGARQEPSATSFGRYPTEPPAGRKTSEKLGMSRNYCSPGDRFAALQRAPGAEV